MAQIKIDIRNKSIADKLKKADEVLAKLGATPPAALAPLADALTTKRDTLRDAATAATNADAEASAKHTLQDTAEGQFDSSYSELAKQAELTAKGDEATLTGWGLDVRSAPAASVVLDALQNFNVSTTNVPGALDFTWDTMPGARNYECQSRKAADATGPWLPLKITGRTRFRAEDLDSGDLYVFRGRALGSGENTGPWSNEITKRVP